MSAPPARAPLVCRHAFGRFCALQRLLRLRCENPCREPHFVLCLFLQRKGHYGRFGKTTPPPGSSNPGDGGPRREGERFFRRSGGIGHKALIFLDPGPHFPPFFASFQRFLAIFPPLTRRKNAKKRGKLVTAEREVLRLPPDFIRRRLLHVGTAFG